MGIKDIKATPVNTKADSGITKTTPAPVQRNNSWENVVSGLNVLGQDKRLMAEPVLTSIDWATAEILWRSDDMAARVIEIIPYEETREGFELCADEQEEEPDPESMGIKAPKPGEKKPAFGAKPKPAAEAKAGAEKNPLKQDIRQDAFPPKKKPDDELEPRPGEEKPAPNKGEGIAIGAPRPEGEPTASGKAGLAPAPVDPNAPEQQDPLAAKPGDPLLNKAAPEDPNATPLGDPEQGTEGAGLDPELEPEEEETPPEEGDDSDPLEELENALLEEMDILAKLYEVRTYARGFGGGAWLLGADDGQRDMAQPLIAEKVRKFEWINVLHPQELYPKSWYGDPTAPKYGEVETYYLVPEHVDGEAGKVVGTQVVHESRIIRFDGVVVSKRHKRSMSNGWGDSVLTRIYDVIRDFQSTWASVGVLMQDFSQTIFKMKGLNELVSSEDPQDALRFRARVRAADYTRSVLNSVMLDADGEDFERKTTSVTGLPEVLEKFAGRLAAASDIPVTRLMGESPAGLNATGASDIRFWYDQIKANQGKHLSKAVRRVAILKAQAMGLKLPEKWTIRWKPLWQLDELQESTRRKTIADMGVALVGCGAITPEELAVSLFGSDTFSAEIKLATKDRSIMAEERKEADAEAAEMNLEAAKAGGGKPGGFGAKPGGSKKPGGFGK